jgi:glyoxylase-like metal-dependent hydrolase (beta-lactamase superfamily II)
MKIQKIVCGPIFTNSYVLYNEHTNDCIIFDPADGEPIIDFVKEKKLSINAILLTHGHFDHISGIPYIVNIFGSIPVYIHKSDIDCLFNPELNGSLDMGEDTDINIPSNIVHEVNENLEIRDFSLKIYNFPGHTPGSIVIEANTTLFTGDFLFKETIGITNINRGSYIDMRNSLIKFREIYENSSINYAILPGHTDSTDLFSELNKNMFLVRINRNH